ncbi:MAG: Stp1/IreP family PP2C-type Ser/Thr phosphatase [Clostridia bacterium]
MRVCQKTHQGLVRASNQDSLLVDEHVFGVADGMGGHKGGETASRVAVQVLKNALHNKSAEEHALRVGIEAANRRVFDMAKHDSGLSGMGTTFTVLWEGKTQLLIGHVGDSRAYRFREGKLEQITEDHSIVAELLRNNVITAEMARNHPYKNVITRAVGIDPVVHVDILKVDKQEDDLWLLCSDGLYNMVSDEDMTDILAAPSENEEAAAEKLLALALAHGGTDNISFVLCRVTEVKAE